MCISVSQTCLCCATTLITIAVSFLVTNCEFVFVYMIQTFDVISTPKPINVAYSTVGLDFHMDLMYYESPPGLQFLHCLRYKGMDALFKKIFLYKHLSSASRDKH